MMDTDQGRGELDWLLASFLRGTPGVIHALVSSGDGLRIAASDRVGSQLGDQLSAATSGLVSLANAGAQLVQLGVMNQTIVELTTGHLFITQIAEGATLTVVASRECDLGMIGYEMTMLATRVGHALTPAIRTGQQWPAG